MSEFYELENEIVRTLKAAKATRFGHPDIISLQKKAMKLSLHGKHDKAAAAYGAIATLIEDDFDLPLRAAHNYQKARSPEDAARWFLRAADRYARQNYPAQAFATLRLYHTLRPDEHHGPKHIYKLCRAQGDSGESLLQFLSSKDRAGQKLRPNDLFAILDEQSFDALLETMIYRHLADGETLARMGDEARSLFFVIRGEVEGHLTFNNRRSHLGTIHAGDICGETAYFTGGRRTTEMSAKGEVELLELPYAMLDALQQNSPALKERLESLYRSRMLVKQLALTPMFAEVDANLREEIAAKMKQVSVGAGKPLFLEGVPSQDLYLVRAGKVAINLQVNGSERLLKTVETGGIIGEMAVAVGGRRTATARTVSDCILMKLDAADYLNFYQQQPELKAILQQRKLVQMAETRDMLQGINKIDGDDTCELLLRDIWQA